MTVQLIASGIPPLPSNTLTDGCGVFVSEGPPRLAHPCNGVPEEKTFDDTSYPIHLSLGAPRSITEQLQLLIELESRKHITLLC